MPIMIGQDVSNTLRRIGGRVARLTGASGLQDWRAAYRKAAERRAPDAVLAAHPNAAFLMRGFSVGAYLERNADVAAVVASPGEAAYHYLEFGHAEGRNALPEFWDAGFVRRVHGLDLPEDLTPVAAAARLRQAGVPVTQAALCEADQWLARGVFGPVFAQIFDH
jgi:hypothetical protein